MKRIWALFIIIVAVFICFISFLIKDSNNLNLDVNNNITTIDMVDNNNLQLVVDDVIKLKAHVSRKFTDNNTSYNWVSSNNEVATVSREGIVKTKKSGSSVITASIGNELIKINLTVYDIKNIIIMVGDSRMDNFKDDNNFMETNKYEVKYKYGGMLDNFKKLYVVSLSGMRYDWLAGIGQYKNANATNYVRDIILHYEDITDEYDKYNIKILFNLGVNDLNHRYLDTDVKDVSLKYLDKLNKLMANEWNSDIINKISLNIVTLFPVNDKQIGCYFPGRYNRDVIEFNKEMVKNSSYTVCDAYNDLDFNDSVFRERLDNKSCSNRDGLHFSSSFNTDVLYSYLVDVCANK